MRVRLEHCGSHWCLLTAVTLNLTFSAYLFTRARQDRWCAPDAAIALVPAALCVHGLLFLGLMHFMSVAA